MSDHQHPAPKAAETGDRLDVNDILADRYGTSPRPSAPRFGRRARILAGAGSLAVGAGFLAWAAFGAAADVEFKDTTFTLVSDSRTDVTFDVYKPEGKAARCAVRALSSNYAIVGWKTVDFAPGESGTLSRSLTLRTEAPAVSAGVEDCWFLEER